MRVGGEAGPHRFLHEEEARSRGRRCGGPSGRRLRRLLEPGCSAAPGRHCLALLPSGPDAVRRLPMRGTWLSTLRAPAQTPDDSAPRAVLGPAIADCGRREPLAPRLARPGEKMVAHRRTLSSPRARSSAGERSLHTREVAGSIPAAPILPSPASLSARGCGLRPPVEAGVCEPRPHLSAAAARPLNAVVTNPYVLPTTDRVFRRFKS